MHEKIEEICDREARIDVLRQNNVTKKNIILKKTKPPKRKIISLLILFP